MRRLLGGGSSGGGGSGGGSGKKDKGKGKRTTNDRSETSSSSSGSPRHHEHRRRRREGPDPDIPSVSEAEEVPVEGAYAEQPGYQQAGYQQPIETQGYTSQDRASEPGPVGSYDPLPPPASAPTGPVLPRTWETTSYASSAYPTSRPSAQGYLNYPGAGGYPSQATYSMTAQPQLAGPAAPVPSTSASYGQGGPEFQESDLSWDKCSQPAEGRVLQGILEAFGRNENILLVELPESRANDGRRPSLIPYQTNEWSHFPAVDSCGLLRCASCVTARPAERFLTHRHDHDVEYASRMNYFRSPRIFPTCINCRIGPEVDKYKICMPSEGGHPHCGRFLDNRYFHSVRARKASEPAVVLTRCYDCRNGYTVVRHPEVFAVLVPFRGLLLVMKRSEVRRLGYYIVARY
ncbi:hypothetical protein F4780DRAFT_729136 [Xylariomycetidae sp. FL0641]|nr:hypothetical protein F4780DRAFT_729136 [Xylariomycetidae sp. FL0641]